VALKSQTNEVIKGLTMARKFKCTNCSEEIITKHLNPGETARCRNCGTYVQVPAAALTTEEQAHYNDSAPSFAEKEKQEISTNTIDLNQIYNRVKRWLDLIKKWRSRNGN
jgi:transcription elongation factor Elf1